MTISAIIANEINTNIFAIRHNDSRQRQKNENGFKTNKKRKEKKTNHFSINALHTKKHSANLMRKKGSNNIQACVYSSVSHLLLARSFAPNLSCISFYIHAVCFNTSHPILAPKLSLIFIRLFSISFFFFFSFFLLLFTFRNDWVMCVCAPRFYFIFLGISVELKLK